MNKTVKQIIYGAFCLMIFPYSNFAIADPFDSFFEEPAFNAAMNTDAPKTSFKQDEPYVTKNKSSVTILPKGADIFDAAMKSYEEISQSDVDLSLAETKLQSDQQAYNAQVTWDVDTGFIHKKATNHGLSKSKYDNDTVIKTSVSLKKTLWDKSLYHSISARKQDIQTAKINQFTEQQRLIESVALSYLEYLAAKDMNDIALRRVNLFTQLTEKINRKKSLGYAANIDVVEVDKQQQTANISLIESQLNLQKAKINLQQITDNNNQNIHYSRSFYQAKKNIDLEPVSYLINKALKNNTELKSLYSEQISLQKVVQGKRAGSSPKLNLVSSLSQAWKFGDPDQDEFDASVGLNMNMPLYTGGRINNQIKQAKLNLLQIERSTNKKRRDIITQLNILSSEFSGALSSYKSLLKLRKQLANNVKLIKVAVPYGVRDSGNLYKALDDQFQLENSLIRQYYDLLKIKIKVMKITGELDSKNLPQLRGLLLATAPTTLY